MSYYPPQQYSQYQPQQQYAVHSAAQYPAYQASGQPPANTSAAYPVFSPVAFKSSPPPPPEIPTIDAPEFPDVTPAIASHTIQRLASSELRHAGFDSAEPAALTLLELECVGLLEQLFRLAHEYANIAGRARPIATDLMIACRDIGLETNDMHRVETLSRKRRRDGLEPEAVTLLAPPSRSPSPEMLHSDDEDTIHPVVPVTLRSHPHYLPPLPPKHTYLRTPAAQPKRSAIPSLEKKLKNASLVQESLENLLRVTEADITDPALKLAMGTTVNWESGVYARKRWKVSGR